VLIVIRATSAATRISKGILICWKTPSFESGTFLIVRDSNVPSSANRSICAFCVSPARMFIFRRIGDTTLDIGPGDRISIAAGSCPGIVVAVEVALGVGERVGSAVSVGKPVGSTVIKACVAAAFAASAVSAMTVGRYSGGYGVGTGLCVDGCKGEQPAIDARRRAMM